MLNSKNQLKIWATMWRVLRAYSLEEKVLTAVAVLFFLFFCFRAALSVFSPTGVLAESGVYTEGIISARPVLVNPLYNDFSQANREVSSLVFAGLLKYDTKTRDFVPDLADWTISDDKKEYIFTLRDGGLWHDGQPVTVDDVLFTFSLIQDEKFQNIILKANFQGVKIEKIDDKSFKFILNRPNAFFITNLNVGILPKHLWEGVPVGDLITNPLNVLPIGAGPYRVAVPVEMDDAGRQRVVLQQFNDYFGRRSHIREIRIRIYPDENALLADSGALNVIPHLNGVALEKMLENKRFSAHPYNLSQYNAVFFNTQSDLLKSAKLRIALVKLINKDDLVSVVANKLRVDTPLMELNQAEWLNKPDLKEANGALFDAGYGFKKDKDGQVLAGEKYRRDAKGKELELNLLVRQTEADSPQALENAKIWDFLVRSWEKGGVKVNIVALPESDYLQAIKTKTYDMILAGQNMGYNLDTYPFWHSSQVGENGLNLSKFSSFAADQQIERIRQTFEHDEKAERLKKLAEIISAEVPALFLYRPNYQFLSDGKVQNIDLNGLAYESDRFVNVADWCIGKECSN